MCPSGSTCLPEDAGCVVSYPGADPGFQVRGAHLKKLRRAEGGAKFFGVFRVKNHDFTPKNHILSNCGGRREILGVFRVKNHDFMQKNLIFSNFRGTRAGCPPWIRPCCHYANTTRRIGLLKSGYHYHLIACNLFSP